MKQPDQQIHDEIFKVSKKLGYDTYISLPSENVSYPFVVLGDTQLLPRPTKSCLIGRVTMTVHVWDKVTKRKRISDMIGSLMNGFSAIKNIEGRQWNMSLSSSSEIIKDNSTVETLYHGILELEFKFI